MIQAIKDSFYITLRDRLAVRYPDRKVNIGGEERPGIVVAENELLAAASPLLEVFHLNWGSAAAVTHDEPAPMFKLVCSISYATEGSDPLNAQDRGRTLAALDSELLAICRPGRTDIEDYGQPTPFASGAVLFWSLPQLAEVQHHARRASRTASVEMFAVMEGAA
jgi:hypothetical protein